MDIEGVIRLLVLVGFVVLLVSLVRNSINIHRELVKRKYDARTEAVKIDPVVGRVTAVVDTISKVFPLQLYFPMFKNIRTFKEVVGGKLDQSSHDNIVTLVKEGLRILDGVLALIMVRGIPRAEPEASTTQVVVAIGDNVITAVQALQIDLEKAWFRYFDSVNAYMMYRDSFPAVIIATYFGFPMIEIGSLDLRYRPKQVPEFEVSPPDFSNVRFSSNGDEAKSQTTEQITNTGGE